MYKTKNIRWVDYINIFLQPRLGPKPFTAPKFNESESFDKVFSVPSVPGAQTNGIQDTKTEQLTEEPTVEPIEKPEIQVSLDTEVVQDIDLNGKADEEETNCDSDYVPKTPSTAERRKLFENRSGSKETDPEDNCDAVDQANNFERMSLQRSSIAERRKMYENKSQSVQDSAPLVEKVGDSPILLRRKDSLKNRKNAVEETPKDDNYRKSVPFTKQQSVPQFGKKVEPVATPTPKRTSTVFGNIL